MKELSVFYEFDCFHVDPVDRRLTREQVVIPVAPLTFNTLLFFTENPNRLVTRAELLRAIWPDTSVGDPNLAVMISVVRKALGDSGRAQKYIETVAKSGYRFVAEVRRGGLDTQEITEPTPAQPEIVLNPDKDKAYPATKHTWIHSTLITQRRAATMLLGILGIAAVLSAFIVSKQNSGAKPRRAREDFSETRTLYLKGRYSWSRGTETGLKQSIVYFNDAIQREPQDAMAYAGLADAYGSLATWSVQPSEVAYRNARTAALRAVQLDEGLSEAHSALGTILMVHDWNFGRAEGEFRRAVALDPTDALAHKRLGTLLAATGRLDSALREVRIAHDLDPLSLDIGVTLGRILYYARRYGEAMTEYRKLVDLDPHYSVAYYYLGQAYFVQGDYAHAMEAFKSSSSLVNDREPMALGLYAAARARDGDPEGARAILAALRARSRKEYVSPLGIAFVYMGLGDGDGALECIEKAFQEHMVTAVYAAVDPLFDSVRSSPRFAAQVKRVNALPATVLPQLVLASR